MMTMTQPWQLERQWRRQQRNDTVNNSSIYNDDINNNSSINNFDDDIDNGDINDDSGINNDDDDDDNISNVNKFSRRQQDATFAGTFFFQNTFPPIEKKTKK